MLSSGKTGARGSPDGFGGSRELGEGAEKKVAKANFCAGPAMCDQKQVEDVGSEVGGRSRLEGG